MTLAAAHDDATRDSTRPGARGARAGATPGDAGAQGAGAMRRCIVTGAVRPKADLIRFVAGPDGGVVPDLAENLPGRGLWLSARRDVLHTACVRNAFAKAAKAPLRPAPDLADQVERLLVRRCVELLGLARRAGQAVGGFERVAGRIASGTVGVLLQARDGAEDGRGKLRTLARAHDPALSIGECFDARELGHAFGDRSFVHVALDRGALARRIWRETARLAGLRETPMEASRPT